LNTTLSIEPVTRIEGHARISIDLDKEGNVADTRLALLSLRGFEKFIEGTPAEEVPRIVTRICGICPWMHHLASVRAVEACFGVTPAPTAEMLRELCLLLAHVQDKLLHFFFLSAPDFLDHDNTPDTRSILTIAQKKPDLTARFIQMRQLVNSMLEHFAGKTIHPVAAVVGGFAKPMSNRELLMFKKGTEQLLDFACYALDFAGREVFPLLTDQMGELGTIQTGFLGTVGDEGQLQLYSGDLRLMHQSGRIYNFQPKDYQDWLAERSLEWTHGKMVYAKGFEEGCTWDLAAPRGIYRTNTLARINVADYIETPRAQEALEFFREQWGRPAQSTMLYHWARLIELVYTCERAMVLLANEDIRSDRVRARAKPAAGNGVGCVEAPRGTLIHHYTTDARGHIAAANMIVGTTHNIAAMNMSVRQAATTLIRNGYYDQDILNQVEMAMRAYDP
jgi:F420-non-reducing hydrogenase large subunit